jgi:ABC-type uncharacterized transport system substrate-binding protein
MIIRHPQYLFMMAFVLVTAILWHSQTALSAKAAKPHVLIVMGSSPNTLWARELTAGIREILEPTCQLSWEYMDARTRPRSLASRGKNIFEKFRHVPLAGIMAAEDAAQAHFVVPFIRDKRSVPTIFLGIRKSPQTYGYPAQNVTGVLERHHLAQTLCFARMLMPESRSVAFMLGKAKARQESVQEITAQSTTFPLQLVSIKELTTLEEALTMARNLQNKTDLLFAVGLDGLTDKNGVPLSARDIFLHMDRIFGKPILGSTELQVRQGALLAVTRDGRIQGKIAASMLLEAMSGTPIQDMPIRTDVPGKRILNIAAMRALGINPKPAVLVGTQLVLPGP